MKQEKFETIIGFAVILITVTFAFFFINNSNYCRNSSGYKILASFQNIEGISKGADVKLAGINIGKVDSITLEEEGYYANVILDIAKDVDIPDDSTAIVSTSGLLGGRYIKINPGASEDNIKNDGKIRYTQSALNFEELIGKLVYSLTSK